MTYPNGYAGVSKLVTAEAFQIISAGLGIISAIVAFASLAGAQNALETGSEASAVGAVAGGIGVVLLSIGVIVLLILSEIFMLIGLKKASADEPKYMKTAFISAIVVLIAGVLGGALSAVPVIGSILKTLASICSIAVFSFTVWGIREFATQLGRNDMISLGTTIIIIQIVQVVLASIANFVGGVFAIIASIVTFVAYIIYLVYLTKAKKMLEA